MPRRTCRYADDEAGCADADSSDDESLLSNRTTGQSAVTENRTTGQPAGGKGKHYDYCFTLNNYNDADAEFIRAFAEECSYLVYQHEKGESGTPHFQGYFKFKSRRSFQAIRRRLSQDGNCRFHLEIRRGTIPQAIDYCTKHDKRDVESNPNIVEFGTRPAGGGSRTDIRDCVGAVKQNKSMRNLFDEHPEVMVKYARGIATARLVYQLQRDFKTIVKWYYGSTGTGKSRAARDEAGDGAYWKAGATKWWDGYDSEETCVIDDYRCDLCPFHILLRLFDRYPMSVEGKGVSMHFVSKLIIVTAPHRPEIMWKNRCNEDIQQLLRRIEEVKLFGEEPAVPEPAILPTFNH